VGASAVAKLFWENSSPVSIRMAKEQNLSLNAQPKYQGCADGLMWLPGNLRKRTKMRRRKVTEKREEKVQPVSKSKQEAENRLNIGLGREEGTILIYE